MARSRWRCIIIANHDLMSDASAAITICPTHLTARNLASPDGYTRTDLWEDGDLNALGAPEIVFGPNGLGSLRVGALEAQVDYVVDRTTKVPRVDFSWSGFDDVDPACGRGRARIEAEAMSGKLFIHMGDVIEFAAVLDASSKGGWLKAMPDIDDLFTDPNASAYVVDEPRSGPPLSYVGEKLRCALEYSHRLARSVQAPHDVKRDADATFRYALTAYLALYNMLGLLSDHRKVEALLELDDHELEDWLTTVQREGSVSG